MKVINNFLNKEDFLKIKSLLLHNVYFPWYLQHGVSNHNDGDIQLVHLFYEEKVNSIYFDLLKPILEKLKVKKLLRIKANFLYKTHKIIQHNYHTDFDNCTTAIFYINTNNGYTIFKKNKKIVKSKENKLCYFNSNMEHAGTTCNNQNCRIVINLNYF
jgi:hypothetical protein